MAERLLVVGAGGAGRQIIDVVEAINASAGRAIWEVEGVVDDAPSEANLELLRARDVPYLGTVADYLPVAADTKYVVGVGLPAVRRAISELFDAAGHTAATALVHPMATLDFAVQLGEGSVVFAGVRLCTNIRSGRHVQININAIVGHEVDIGDFVTISPLSSVVGGCSIGDDVFIGIGSTVINQVSIGAGTVVAAAACVVRDAPPGVVLMGVPAR